jgi:hypothetical protein
MEMDKMANVNHRTKPSRNRKRANARNKEWKSLPAQIQLDRLDARLGNGVGAVQQRTRLQKKLLLEMQSFIA